MRKEDERESLGESLLTIALTTTVAIYLLGYVLVAWM